MNEKLKKRESRPKQPMERTVTKSNTQSKAEAKPIIDSKPDTLPPESNAEKDKQRPFYKRVEFFLSLAALLISLAALLISSYFSFLNSPFSSFTTPRIEYESELASDVVSADPKEGGAKLTAMVGIIKNISNATAEDVLVTLWRLEKGKPKIAFCDLEHNIVEETDITTIIKIPHFPPKYSCKFVTLASSEPSLTANENGSKHLSFPCIKSVTYRNGVGIPRNDPCNFRGFQQK